VSLRAKEEEHDYRYFPEPDLVPMEISSEQVEHLRSKMPELPDARRDRFVAEYQIPIYDAGVLTASKSLADFFEAAITLYDDPKDISNWIMSDFLRHLNDKNIEINESTVTPAQFTQLLKHIQSGKVSRRSAKKVLWDMMEEGKPPDQIIEEDGHHRLDDEAEIERIVNQVVEENPKAVQDALTDDKAINFLIGQVMQKTQGTADYNITNDVIRRRLAEIRKG
jgi:aspartyl-tRNA(Asn)/glutamyl-tRNA(Gln) amidotransferase subunit B